MFVAIAAAVGMGGAGCGSHVRGWWMGWSTALGEKEPEKMVGFSREIERERERVEEREKPK